MWVGKVLWPANTKMDSRFSTAQSARYCCELCSKSLTSSLTSWRVPVVGVDPLGQTHGMWVGSDCAKKFLPGVHTDVQAPDGSRDHDNMVLEG